MEITKFKHMDFGNLTTITNPKTGNTVFVASEVAKMWGHKSFTQTIKRLLKADEFIKVNRTEHPDIMKEFVTTKLISAKTQSIVLLTESGLYKMALASNLPSSQPFRDWVTAEVIPSIRKTGGYSVASWDFDKLKKHNDKSVQLSSSKEINSYNYEKGGVDKIIEYNKQSCILHTGLTPKEIMEIAKQKGLKASERTSAKEVLRNTNPAVACGMSFTDSLVKQGFDLKTVSELTKKAAIPLFEGMMELGINIIDK